MRNEAEFRKALAFFSAGEQRLLSACAGNAVGAVCEIRLYTGKAALLQTDKGLFFCCGDGRLADTALPDRWVPDANAVFGVLSRASSYSLFLYEEDLRQCFLTKNGCRIGICGVDAAGKVTAAGISSLHIRIPYTVEHERHPLLERVLRDRGGVLAAGPPCSGKTTLLKRCVYYFSGGVLGRYYSTAVIDTRGEFADAAAGDPAVITADLLPAADKASGLETAVRLLAPEVVVCDEIGSPAEARQLRGMAHAGVRICASVHAGDPAELAEKKQIVSLLRSGVFRHVLFLSGSSRGEIVRYLRWEETDYEICGRGAAVAAAAAPRPAAGGYAETAGAAVDVLL